MHVKHFLYHKREVISNYRIPYLYSFKIYHHTSGHQISTNQSSFLHKKIFFFFFKVKIPKIMKHVHGCK